MMSVPIYFILQPKALMEDKAQSCSHISGRESIRICVVEDWILCSNLCYMSMVDPVGKCTLKPQPQIATHGLYIMSHMTDHPGD